MATAPNCAKNAQMARMRRAHHDKQNKEDAAWNKLLEDNKYPKCVGWKIFDDCPDVVDESKVLSQCRSCVQYVPTKEDIQKRHAELSALLEGMKKRK